MIFLYYYFGKSVQLLYNFEIEVIYNCRFSATNS